MDNSFFHTLRQFFNMNAWIVSVVFTLLVVLIFHWVFAAVYRRLMPRLQKTSRTWDDTFLSALYSPVIWYAWALAITIILPTLLHELGWASNAATYLSPLRELLFVIGLFWFAMRYISRVEKNVVERIVVGQYKRDRTTVRALSQLVRICVVVIAVLLGMQALNLPIATLLAAGGVGGIAISFAAKDTLANFLGGLMIFWDRPFSVGDWIRSPDRNIEGTVENIGWRLTRIRTFDKRPLYVPNGVFSLISVENPSRMTNRRIKTSIGVRYDDAKKLGPIIADVRNMLKEHPEIDQNLTTLVNFDTFAPSSLDILIYTFTKTTDWGKWLDIQQDVYLKIIDIIDHHGAECAFPTSTVHVPQELKVDQTQ